MMDSRIARRMRRLPLSRSLDEFRDEPLADRLERVAERHARKAIAELERRELDRRESSERKK